ncbi:hypothetical protein K469DRAFT_690606 [Zopfia rhizophila CBS 207.26]|uniref:Cytidyltransferase-like domain-containing protein n=1 Tax=Zopfia rhizophila CBS 207.26 TaxID=1314779 RepID=A0A6A6DXB1_9PEZI|nr:hypothetical protein K469DRAFT_690606 [Zopfia rhizophila CBS 207.26]
MSLNYESGMHTLTTSVFLEYHIGIANGFPISPDDKIFTPALHLAPSTLSKCHTNRIVVYRGSFNPPRNGHKQVLCQAFFKAPQEPNFVAAIIRFRDTKGVEKKGNPSVLTTKQQVKLWNDDSLVGSFHRVYDRMTMNNANSRSNWLDTHGKVVTGYNLRRLPGRAMCP